jgi:signal transduction histidine kinase
MLCLTFLLAVTLEHSETPQVWARTYALLTLYAAAAVIIAAATWRNWWLDARLAVVTHAADMMVFTAIVFSSNSTTSPFFLFFVLPLLAAAIRWSWRDTALTATALVLLYMIAGLLITGTGSFELERFVLRAGNLLILSLLLIWFGMHQRRTQLFFRVEDFDAGLDERENPLARGLAFAMRRSGAAGGVLMVGTAGDDSFDGLAVSDGASRNFSVERPLVSYTAAPAFLYDVAGNRALTRPSEGRFRFLAATDVINLDQVLQLGLTEGLIAEVRTGTLKGWLVLWGIADLSTDYIDVGRELGNAAGAILDRHALLSAIESGAAARTRLALARDVHDSIVQFLAGAAFRIEAIKRSSRSGAEVGAELDELKRLLIEEQGEIRGFVTALRRGREIELAEAVAELRVLAERLSQQWSVDCCLIANGEQASIPIRLQLDLQQLLREAVANAVRHGGAKRIEVGLTVEGTLLQLSVADDGSGFPAANGKAAIEPWSLKERVERANGSLRLVSAPGSTNILISLPLVVGATA